MKDKIFSFIRIAISLSLLCFLFWLMRDDVGSICGTLRASNMYYLVLALGISVVNNVILGVRLKMVFRGENLEVSLWEAVQLTYVGSYFNNFMPTAVGGDIIKAHYASLHNGKKVRTYASVLMDRFIGLYTFLVLAGVALIIDQGRFQLKSAKQLIVILLIGGVAGFIVATNKKAAVYMEKIFDKMKMLRLGERLNSIYDIVHDYRNRKDVVIKSFLISLVGIALYFVTIYLFFLSLGVPVSLGNIFLIMPIVTFISMIPSVGGLGVREGAMVTLFAPLVGKEVAFAVSLLLLLGLLVISAIGGGIYLWWSLTGAWKAKHHDK